MCIRGALPVIRVRFHGRGGHGIKTASRILGTAAFLSGYQAQDSPLYGAERRGAAVTASTRIDSEPIRERGIIPDPDLIIVADETLLADSSTGVLIGAESAARLFVNSPRKADDLRRQLRLPCPALANDLTAHTMQFLGKGSALSAPLGAVTCALTGIISSDQLAEAVRQELADLDLPEELIVKNIALAQQVYDYTPRIALRAKAPSSAPLTMHTPTFLPSAQGVPTILNPGNSASRHTGSWRIFRPIIDHSACTRCQICLIRCPDSAIALDADGLPVIDYDNCKGCMICREECPIHCIGEQKEVGAW